MLRRILDRKILAGCINDHVSKTLFEDLTSELSNSAKIRNEVFLDFARARCTTNILIILYGKMNISEVRYVQTRSHQWHHQ